MALRNKNTMIILILITLLSSSAYTYNVIIANAESSLDKNNNKFLVGPDMYVHVMDKKGWKMLQNPSMYRSLYNYNDIKVGTSVKIISKTNLVGYDFYKIKYKSKNSYKIGWVYSGNIRNSSKSNGKNIEIDKIQSKIINKSKEKSKENKKDSVSSEDKDGVKENKKESVSSEDKDGVKEARQQMLSDVNSDRASVGVAPLKEDETLDKLAQLRATQIIKSFDHYDENGKSYVNIDAPQVGLPKYFDCSENISQALGINSTDAAKYANKLLWIDEKGANPDQDGGHRLNIRDPGNTYIGIGVAYDENTDTWFYAQDFGDDNLSSSQCLNPNGNVWNEKLWSDIESNVNQLSNDQQK